MLKGIILTKVCQYNMRVKRYSFFDYKSIVSKPNNKMIMIFEFRIKYFDFQEKSGTIRYRELIDDVRAHKTPDEANFVQEMYREVERQNKEERKIQEVIESLEGTELSGMLTNLNKVYYLRFSLYLIKRYIYMVCHFHCS